MGCAGQVVGIGGRAEQPLLSFFNGPLAGIADRSLVHLLVPGKVKRLHWPITDPAGADPAVDRDKALAAFRTARDQIQQRLGVLDALRGVTTGPVGTQEFHASIRVSDLACSTGFCA